AEANEAAIQRIADFAQELDIACGLERKSAYVYTQSDKDVAQLEAEVRAASRLGLPATFTRETALPFPVAGAVRFDGQAQCNPVSYLVGLARGFAQGGQIFEQTRVVKVEAGENCRVRTDSGATVTAQDVI